MLAVASDCAYLSTPQILGLCRTRNYADKAAGRIRTDSCTAQDPSTPGGANDAWFTAVAPVDHPEVAVTVLVRGGGDGDVTAEPVAESVLGQFAQQRTQILGRQD